MDLWKKNPNNKEKYNFEVLCGGKIEFNEI